MKHPNSHTPVQPHLQNLQSNLQNLFRKPTVDFLTGILIFISVGLTLLELSQSPGSPQESKLEAIQQFITGLFALELSIRWFISPSKPHFLKTYGLDLFAVLPLLQLVGFPPAIRLFRLLRILRLFTRLIHSIAIISD